MVWIQFLVAATVTVIAAYFLAKYADVISIRTGLGGLLIGTILVSAATSLPEFLTGIRAVQEGTPTLFVGNIFGSVMFNIVLLAILDLSHRQKRILRRIVPLHAITAGLSILLITLAILFLMVKLDWVIGWVGIDSLLLIAIYVIGVQIIRSQSTRVTETQSTEIPEGLTSMPIAITGFSLASLALIVVIPLLVSSTNAIAGILGLTTGFVGILLVGIVTSLPELITTWSAVHIGAYDLAVGNLFGSNMFNIFALGLTDVLVFEGGLFQTIQDPSLIIAGLLGIILITIALVGNLTHAERRIWIFEVDALTILVVYILGMLLLYSQAIVN